MRKTFPLKYQAHHMCRIFLRKYSLLQHGRLLFIDECSLYVYKMFFFLNLVGVAYIHVRL